MVRTHFPLVIGYHDDIWSEYLLLAHYHLVDSAFSSPTGLVGHLHEHHNEPWLPFWEVSSRTFFFSFLLELNSYSCSLSFL